MENTNLPQDTGLTFYSRVSASISHELKNALAVINESAGFLEDLTHMAKKGIPLDPDRLVPLAGTMLKQVQRANGIIKNMNRLAHSLDEKQAAIDLNALLELMAGVSERTAVNKGLKISFSPHETAISLHTRPFFLETLVWFLLEAAMDVCGKGGTIELSATPAGAGATIELAGLSELTADTAKDIFAGRLAPLLAELAAEPEAIAAEGRLVVSLPASVAPELNE